MGGPTDDPYMRELARRALEDAMGADGAQRLRNGEYDFDDDEFVEVEREPDPVLDDFFNGTNLRALSSARDGLADAKVRYDAAVIGARAAGWSWSEMARILGVSKQSLHTRFRDRAPG